MSKIGLALSGGGFRATLYHLGVVRYLKDAGALQNVTDIAAVSGGCILAAHLVLNWERYNGDDASFNEAASEILKFVQFDVRNHIVRRIPLQVPLRLISKLPFLDSRKFTPNYLLECYYKKYLYGDRCLYELPEEPKLHMLATNVSTGALSAFNRDGLFIQQRRIAEGKHFLHIPGLLASIPRVVGASSAFPGFFPPVQITASDLGVPEGQFSTEYFTDGGVYDNLGLRAFLWLVERGVEFEHILVSDAGKPFQILSDAALGFVGQSLRATDILWDRVWQLERENFGHHEGFSFIPMTEVVGPKDDPTAQHSVIQSEIQTIRTDLDRFSPLEINALVQHGYEVSRKLCRQKKIVNDKQQADIPPWKPFPEKKMPFFSRLGSTAKPTKLARHLRNSSQRRVWSTMLDWRDWPSYIYIILMFAVIFYLPFQVYQLYRTSQIQADVIQSIASGNPDVHTILELATSDPTVDWVPDEIGEKPERTTVSTEGIEIITHSRFFDIRRWHPQEESLGEQGKVYILDRVTLKFLESYKGDRHVTFSIPTILKNAEFRQPSEGLRGKISKVIKPVVIADQEMRVYELDYDLSHALPEEPFTLETEVIANAPQTTSVPIVVRNKTDFLSVWVLFPSDKPYKSYSLVSYPMDKSAPPSIMKKNYVIDHPYGFLIGWSVINPEPFRVYECRWTYE